MTWIDLHKSVKEFEDELKHHRMKQSINKRNPWGNMQARSFFSGDSGRFFEGWDSQSHSIDFYLREELTKLRARSRRLVRMNPIGKRAVALFKSNVVGPSGVQIQAQSRSFMNGQDQLDKGANEAIEAAFMDWATFHCDFKGQHDFVDQQNIAISNSVQDGEFVFRKHYGKSAGKYGFQLESLDPELLDTQKNQPTKDGQIRLGVEYGRNGRVVRYWFREKNFNGDYNSGRTYSIDAKYIIHGFMSEWPDQSRGIPWIHAGLETAKHLEKYEESAIVASRAKAGAMGFVKSNGEDKYRGEEDASDTYGEGATLDQMDAGTIKDIGNNEFVDWDPKYPHEMYDPFIKSTLRRISSGWGLSYHALSMDLADVNFSSIRAGVLEDREIFKGIQNWFIRVLIRRVYEEWLLFAYTMGEIKVGSTPLSRPVDQYMPAKFQPRRWAWVDPQKDGEANKLAIEQRLKSRSQIIRDQGDDPETIWNEIQREEDYLKKLGISVIQTESSANGNKPNQKDTD